MNATTCLCLIILTTYLTLQNYKLFCKEIAEEHEELTGSGGLLGQNAYSST